METALVVALAFTGVVALILALLIAGSQKSPGDDGED